MSSFPQKPLWRIKHLLISNKANHATNWFNMFLSTPSFSQPSSSSVYSIHSLLFLPFHLSLSSFLTPSISSFLLAISWLVSLSTTVCFLFLSSLIHFFRFLFKILTIRVTICYGIYVLIPENYLNNSIQNEPLMLSKCPLTIHRHLSKSISSLVRLFSDQLFVCFHLGSSLWEI